MAVSPAIKLNQFSPEWERPTADWKTGSRFIFPLFEKCVIEACTIRPMWHGLHMPDRIAKRARPSCGVVIASDGLTINPGDVVIYRPGDGLEQEATQIGDYNPKEPLRFFGVYVPLLFANHARKAPVYDSILAVWTEDNCLDPTGENVLIQLVPPDDKIKGLEIADETKTYSWTGTVLGTGPDCEWVQPNDFVSIHPNSVAELQLDAFGPHLAICNEAGVLALIGRT